MEKGFQASLEQFVLLSREEADSLKSRAKGAHNLNLHLQENELELRKERKRSKELEKLLLEAHKRIGDLTLKQKNEIPPSDGHEPVYSLSMPMPPSNLHSSELQIDGVPTSGSSGQHVKDLSLKDKSGLVDQVVSTGKSHQITQPEPRIFKFPEKVINVSSTDSSMKENLGESLPRGSKSVKDSEKETVGGVSVQYFNKVKMELIKTKKYLKQNQIDLNQLEIQRHNQQRMEAMEKELKTVKRDRDDCMEKLQFYKGRLHQSMEGATVHSSDSDRLYDFCKSTTEMSSMTDSSCQTSPFLRPLISPKSSSDHSSTDDNKAEKGDKHGIQMRDRGTSPDVNQMMKDTQNQLQRLAGQLGEQQFTNERLVNENKAIKNNYQQLLMTLRDMERLHEKSELNMKKMKLEEENFSLKKAISEYEEDNNHLLSTIEVINNNMSKERDKAVRLEASLREEQRCHGLTKHNLYVMYGNLKTKFDKLAHEKNLLEQRLVIASSGGGTRLVSMATGATPERRITPQSSTEMDPVTCTPEIHIYENVARQLEPARTQYVDNKLNQLRDSSSDPERVMSVREPVESCHPYDDDLPQNSSQSPPNDPPENVTSQFLCKRCLNEFDLEMDFLCHIEKCLID